MIAQHFQSYLIISLECMNYTAILAQDLSEGLRNLKPADRNLSLLSPEKTFRYQRHCMQHKFSLFALREVSGTPDLKTDPLALIDESTSREKSRERET